MSKTNIILLIITLFLLMGGAVAGYLVINPKKPTLPKAANNRLFPQASPGMADDLEYADSAGFSFKYPKAGSVSDIAGSLDVYSKLKISYKDVSVEFSAIDTKYQKVDDAAPAGAALAGATKLGNLSAKQYSTSANFYTIAIDQGILYMLTGPKASEDLQNLISSTFVFADQKAADAYSGASGTIYEEEEVIE